VLGAAALIARNDLRRRLRSRAFVLQAFVGPLVLAGVVSLAFGGGFGVHEKIGVVTIDRSSLADGLGKGLVASNGHGLTFSLVPNLETARQRVKSGKLDGAIVIPAGFQDALARPTPLALEVVTDPHAQIGGAVARSVAGGLAARINAARVATFALLADGRPAPPPESLLHLDLPVSLNQLGSGGTLSPAASIGPGMGLLFLFLSIGTVARGILEERRIRVLDRIRSSPVSLTSILLGKCAGLVLVGCVSMTVLWGATTALLGAYWGTPGGVMLLIFASSLAVAAISGVVAAVAKTEQTAETYATMVAFVFGIVGGSLVPLSQLSPPLLRLSLATPNGWALRGFAQLSAGQGSVGDILPHVGVLLLWAVGASLLAARLLPRRLGTR
jgi:ABC-2 type transport system permease protein